MRGSGVGGKKRMGGINNRVRVAVPLTSRGNASGANVSMVRRVSQSTYDLRLFQSGREFKDSRRGSFGADCRIAESENKTNQLMITHSHSHTHSHAHAYASTRRQKNRKHV